MKRAIARQFTHCRALNATGTEKLLPLTSELAGVLRDRSGLWRTTDSGGGECLVCILLQHNWSEKHRHIRSRRHDALGGSDKLMKSWRPLFSLHIAMVFCSLPSQAIALEPARSALRYVFLIDTSGPMAGQKRELAGAIARRIESGWDGQMRAGELFAIWTYGSALSTNRYLPMAWVPTAKHVIAEHLLRVFDDQPFKGQGRLDHALLEVSSIVASLESVIILIASDGRQTVVGTPYDKKINACLRHARGRDGVSEKVFVTALLARRGEVVAWSVQTASGTPLSPGIGMEMSSVAEKLEPETKPGNEIAAKPADSKQPLLPTESSATAKTAPEVNAAVQTVEDQSKPRPAEGSMLEADAFLTFNPLGDEDPKAADDVRQPTESTTTTPDSPATAAPLLATLEAGKVMDSTPTGLSLSGPEVDPGDSRRPPNVNQAQITDAPVKAPAPEVPRPAPAAPIPSAVEHRTNVQAVGRAPIAIAPVAAAKPPDQPAAAPPTLDAERIAPLPGQPNTYSGSLLAIGISLLVLATATLFWCARMNSSGSRSSLISQSLDPQNPSK